MDILNSLFKSILTMSLCACAIIPVVLLLRLILKKAPKWVNVLLWGIVALSLIVAPITVNLCSDTPSEPISEQLLDEATIPLTTSPSQHPPHVPPTPDPDDQNTLDKIILFIMYIPEKISEFIDEDNTDPSLVIFSIVWVLGAVSMLSYTSVSYWRLRRKVATAVRLIENIYQSENVGFPFVLGFFKPRIYLPFKINLQDLEHVIAHEQAHIRRKDHWWKPLGFLLLTIHWFNPLMWLAYILLCRDIELACDEKVIRDLGSEQKADYTQALVTCSVKRHMVTACPLAFGAVGVKDRVKAVMNYRKPTLRIKLISIIVCIAMSISSLTLTFLSSYSVPNGKLLFDSATGTIVGYIGSPTKIEIPSEIDGVAVVAIGPGALRFCSSLTSVIIPEGVKTIGAFAFAHCANLRYVKLPDSVKSIGRLAFRLCENLTGIDLPEGLESIGNEAFAYSGLTNITIPKSVEIMGFGVFSMCSSLKAIRVDEDNPNYSSDENGVLFNKDQTELHTYPAALRGSYMVPSGVTKIGPYAFSGSSLTRINRLDGVTVIGTAAFYHCSNLTQITLPYGMTAIDNSAFAKCSSLTSIAIPASTTSFGSSVFSGCNNLNGIHFSGTEAQWERLTNGIHNYNGAIIHYNAV